MIRFDRGRDPAGSAQEHLDAAVARGHRHVVPQSV